jgi:hypothetical protein
VRRPERRPFSNRGDDSGTGENTLYGEYLANSKGEDVVAGIHTPKSLVSPQADMPEVARPLDAMRDRLEGYYKDVHDCDITIERGLVLPADPQRQDERRCPGAHLRCNGQGFFQGSPLAGQFGDECFKEFRGGGAGGGDLGLQLVD